MRNISLHPVHTTSSVKQLGTITGLPEMNNTRLSEWRGKLGENKFEDEIISKIKDNPIS
jgi:hypothetical protein